MTGIFRSNLMMSSTFKAYAQISLKILLISISGLSTCLDSEPNAIESNRSIKTLES